MLVTVVAIMAIELFNYQEKAKNELKSGSILCGGVGSGKSRTALAYYFLEECGGKLKINGKGDYAPMKNPKDLYIITTARKRDKLEWEGECAPFTLSTNQEVSVGGVKVVVDSWNNIWKYKSVENAFFIFDEQRLVGSGVWVKSFLKITKKNHWILLSATPGDIWMDYVPVFIANGFYKNRTEFLRRHVVYSRFTKYPKVDRYIEIGHLVRLKQKIIVYMEYQKPTISHYETLISSFDKDLFEKLTVKRWNVFENKPIKNVSELCYLTRRLVNSDPSRLSLLEETIKKHSKIIVFYNFDYELEILRGFSKRIKIPVSEYNGHKHEEIPNTDKWLYLVQYTAGAEGWNCTETNCVVFYSQHYSYKIRTQAAGRVDRLNTLFTDLYYYNIQSKASIDLSIEKAFKEKKNFNERRYFAENILTSREKHML